MASKETEAIGLNDAPPPYPSQQGSYPPQQGGYPPQQGGYPPQQGGYPPQQGGYPPQQGGYPSQGAYPPPQPAAPQMHSTTTNVVVTGAAPTQHVIVRETQSRSVTGLDIAGLVLGIIGIVCCLSPISIIATILSGIAFCSRSEGNHKTADVLTYVSLGLTALGVVLVIITIVLIVVFVVNATDEDSYYGGY